MRQTNSDQIQIKEELSKFINLLQGEFRPTHNTLSDLRAPPEYTLSKKLSVILSASQPQSSSLDKENSNPSANRSFESNQKPCERANWQSVMQAFLKTPLTPTQLKLLQKLKECFQYLKAQRQLSDSRCETMQKELTVEKAANDQMLNVLMGLDKQEKELWNNYNIVSGKYQEAGDKYRRLEIQFEKMKESLLALQNDNDFMKKLIFHANENYEALEKRCCELEMLKDRSGATTDRKSAKTSSVDNLMKSARTKKNGQSPCGSELLSSPSHESFQQIYRKMILRTLKHKGRSQKRS